MRKGATLVELWSLRKVKYPSLNLLCLLFQFSLYKNEKTCPYPNGKLKLFIVFWLCLCLRVWWRFHGRSDYLVKLNILIIMLQQQIMTELRVGVVSFTVTSRFINLIFACARPTCSVLHLLFRNLSLTVNSFNSFLKNTPGNMLHSQQYSE